MCKPLDDGQVQILRSSSISTRCVICGCIHQDDELTYFCFSKIDWWHRLQRLVFWVFVFWLEHGELWETSWFTFVWKFWGRGHQPPVSCTAKETFLERFSVVFPSPRPKLCESKVQNWLWTSNNTTHLTSGVAIFTIKFCYTQLTLHACRLEHEKD